MEGWNRVDLWAFGLTLGSMRWVAKMKAGIMCDSRKAWLFVGALYVITWIGGYLSHSFVLSKHAEQLYAGARETEIERAADYKSYGGPPPRPVALAGGPIAKVDWCFPVLPGVLVANSQYVIGPLYGRGGIRILIFDGTGFWDSGPIWGWIS